MTALEVAQGEVGYDRYADPEEGTKYGRWYADLTGEPYYGMSGVPYCAMFVSWCLDQAGQTCAGFPAAYVPYALSAAIGAGAVLDDKTAARPGDVVVFDWDGNEVDHVGFCEANDSTLYTIEGNTNNGKVARRERAWATVAAVIRPDAQAQPEEPSDATREAPMVCIIDFNSEGKAVYFDGCRLHWLSHPDEIKVLDSIHQITTGRPMPFFKLGREDAPWASRLQQAVEDDGMDALRHFAPRA